MTRNTNARIAGFTYLFYAAIGICLELLMHRARSVGGDSATKLVGMGEHATEVRIAILITLLECFSALVLAVTLYRITRDQNRELAMLAMVCRVAEGVLGTLIIPNYLALLWLAKAAGTGAPDIPTTNALGTFLLMPVPSVPIGTIFFAVGSTIFSWLLLRGRMVPALIAWLGVFASGLLAVLLPLQLAGFSTGPLTGYYQWLPALVFQIVLALWLLIRGVATPDPLSVVVPE
jgi:hypothetical protein